VRRAGANIETVENGRLAVDKAQSEPFDLILMDINMPEMDGYEATRLLRDRSFDRPIVALTANAMLGDSERCLQAGCNEYLSKPIDRTQLIHTIARLVGRKAIAKPQTPPNETEPVDERKVIVSQFINDPDVAGILPGFVSRLDGQLAAMRDAFAGNHQEELQRLAHRLKGSGGSYGYPSLTEACRDLEDASKTHNRAIANTALDTVAEIIDAIHNGYNADALAGKTA
jgi:CheY-like chemotaxis protein